MSNKKTSTKKANASKKNENSVKKSAPKKAEIKKEKQENSTKNKETFFSKHASTLVIAGLLIIFGAIIIATGGETKKKTSTNSNEVLVNMSVSEWQAAVREDEFVVTTFAQTTCSWCNEFKPVAKSVAEKYNLQIVWIDVDTIPTEDEYNKLTTTFDELQSFGTPLTLITKDGKVVEQVSGYVDEASFVSTLKDTGVIK